MANLIHAQIIPKPTVPEFTLSFITHSPFTGSTSTKLVVNGIEINITNQPYAYSFNGTTYVLCYDYRYKAHSEQNWEESSFSLNNSYPLQSNSSTTILTVPEISIPQQSGDVQIDFQVQAIAGHYYQTETGTFIFPDETSGWSPTYTITIPRPTPSLPYPPSPSPTIPEFSGWMILPLLIIMSLLVYLKKEKSEREPLEETDSLVDALLVGLNLLF